LAARRLLEVTPRHAPATPDRRNLAKALITTDQVVRVAITLTRMRVSHKLAAFIGERLPSGKIACIHSTTPDENHTAVDRLGRDSDKSYSAFDRLTFVVMERPGIREALAIDEHFTHRCAAIPGPFPRAGRWRSLAKLRPEWTRHWT
jgi:predicted nucleic acid-binding protein